MGRCPRADTHDARHKTTQSRNHIKTHNWYIAKQVILTRNKNWFWSNQHLIIHGIPF